MPQDCRSDAFDCEDVGVLNQLDGFSMHARMSVRFDGDIDPASVTSKSVCLVKLRDALSGREDGDAIVDINYIVWDPTSRELSFRPDNLLDQHTRYALVVTTGLRDAHGRAIGVSAEFSGSSKDLACGAKHNCGPSTATRVAVSGIGPESLQQLYIDAHRS